MEYWDLYDEKRKKLDKTIMKTNDMKNGEYHIVVNIWIMNSENLLLIIQRHPEKTWPLKWECIGGALISGEDSITGALREVEEEIGVKLNKNNGKLIYSRKRKTDFKDTYIFKENINIKDTKLEDNAVVNIKWVTKDELTIMVKNNEIAEPIVDEIYKLIEMEKI